MAEIKMTKLAECAGCGAKVGAGMLAALLGDIPSIKDQNLLVVYDTSDDAAIYQVSEDLALVQTLDFFPPIVDDPFTFGQIAAANAISDIYAMGGEPKIALNILCIPKDLPSEAVHAILSGGYSKAAEAGVIIAGGHSIHDREPKYGLSVTGFIHPKKILCNNSAREGDVLILTKALGTGILNTAQKAEMLSAEQYAPVVAQMATLNKAARDVMMKYDVHSCTDVTGFSLMGHSLEMTKEKVTAVIDSSAVPILDGALDFAMMGLCPEGMYRNRHFAESHVKVMPGVAREMMDVLFDPQTSGGLLIAVSEADAMAMLDEMRDCVPNARIIGHVAGLRSDCSIVVK